MNKKFRKTGKIAALKKSCHSLLLTICRFYLNNHTFEMQLMGISIKWMQILFAIQIKILILSLSVHFNKNVHLFSCSPP